jgi:hypothetical protein
VSVAPFEAVSPAAFGPGFLGSRYAPAIVGRNASAPGGPPRRGRRNELADLRLDDIDFPGDVDARQAARRMELWTRLERQFLENHSGGGFEAHHALYRKAADMMRPEVRAAFDLSDEPEEVRRKYGPGLFGQGCLLARRLVERGVPFVEVGLGEGLGWDTHIDNFKTLPRLLGELDDGWAALMTELAERDLLTSTTILWMGEFGRTPQINPQAGRDHFPNAWTCVLAGGGIAGGQAYGRTSADGTTVEENPTAIGDVLATLCTALGVPPETENYTPEERPIKIAEGTPIEAVLA